MPTSFKAQLNLMSATMLSFRFLCLVSFFGIAKSQWDTIGELSVRGTPEEVVLSPDPNTWLALNQTSRLIYVIGTLDYEAQPKIRWTIMCKERNGLTPTEVSLQVTVVLIDDNDNTPQFTQPHYYANISEMLRVGGTVIQGISATDKDRQGQQIVTFSIVPGPQSEYFDIPLPLQGRVKLQKRVDYEKVQVLNVVIKVEDLHDQPLSSFANLTVYVEDEDDSNPAFNKEQYRLTTGPLKKGSTVDVTFMARDLDRSIDAPLTFAIYDAEGALEIDPKSARISTTKDLVYTGYTIVAVIKATQVDNADRYTTAILEIVIFGESTKPSIPTTTQKVITLTPKVTISTLKPNSTTQNPNITTEISNTTENPNITQVSNTTQTTNVTSQGPNTTQSNTTTQSTTPTTQNRTSPTTPTTPTTSIPVENFPPKSISIDVDEDFAVGRVVHIIGDSDDMVPMWKFTMAKHKKFKLSPSGAIRLIEQLDYETKVEHILTVTVTDRYSRTSISKVLIKVIDVNEYPPEVTPPEEEIKIERKSGVKVASVKAKDKDAKSVFTYSVAPSETFFSIDQRGAIFSTSNITKLTSERYHLTAIVKDNGKPSLTTVATVTFRLPSVPPRVLQTVERETDETTVIILGIVCGILFISVVLLVVYIIMRRMYAEEKMTKARPTIYDDAAGLHYKNTVSRDLSQQMYAYNHDDQSDVTTNCDDDRNGEAINGALVSSVEDISDIDIQTAMTPHPDYPKSSGDYRENGGMTTFGDRKDDSGYSNGGIVGDTGGLYHTTLTPWPQVNGLHKSTSSELATSIAPIDDKPEITVYF